ncbi:protein phosphatase 1 regulatory subunit 27 isoform X2 [Neoarius graeffei]|uniref:protein phosphatase 1 regulatory subunit 27 isoform X2 n=1 Tax=Neoarius graeffei TaxID=443677 RepID=UPI00298D42F2|nr:protein phosphatase 1 regulatory subunit 27 isoform X2 [Neoarius graeffei]
MGRSSVQTLLKQEPLHRARIQLPSSSSSRQIRMIPAKFPSENGLFIHSRADQEVNAGKMEVPSQIRIALNWEIVNLRSGSPGRIMTEDHVRHGDLEMIGRFMRAKKVRVDTIFHSGMAALHEAVLSGNLECVKLLIKYGADVHQRDEDGWTPLHMACSDGYPEIARYLLFLGASAEAENANGEKPADLIDPDCKELVKLFEVGCV